MQLLRIALIRPFVESPLAKMVPEGYGTPRYGRPCMSSACHEAGDAIGCLELSFGRRQMARHELVHFFARPLSMRGQLQEPTHVLNREAKFPRVTDEAEPLLVLDRIVA